MGDVIDFDGATTEEIPVEKVLDMAKDCDTVLVLGWKNDDFYCAMSDPRFAENILLVTIGKKVMLDVMLEMMNE